MKHLFPINILTKYKMHSSYTPMKNQKQEPKFNSKSKSKEKKPDYSEQRRNKREQ